MYFVWEFILEIREGEVADKGMFGLGETDRNCRIQVKIWDTHCNQ